MKKIKNFTLPFVFLLILSSCVSVRVVADYDREKDFKEYNTYAFYKTGIDKAQISDLDKKRILRAIETEMTNRGFTKSQDPDILVSIFTKEREQVDVYNNNWSQSQIDTYVDQQLVKAETVLDEIDGLGAKKRSRSS